MQENGLMAEVLDKERPWLSCSLSCDDRWEAAEVLICNAGDDWHGHQARSRLNMQFTIQRLIPFSASLVKVHNRLRRLFSFSILEAIQERKNSTFSRDVMINGYIFEIQTA